MEKHVSRVARAIPRGASSQVQNKQLVAGTEQVHSLQLWLNLPAKMKMIPARYQDQRVADTPTRRVSGGEIRVYAGKSGEVSHTHGSDWPIWLLEIHLEKGARFLQEVPQE